MPIDSRHPLYNEFIGDWQKCRDTFNGTRSVKGRASSVGGSLGGSDTYEGSYYLPPLSGQSKSEYMAYKGRALFNNITGRATHGLVGVMTRLNPTIEAPDDMAEYFTDATGTGITFNELLRFSILEILLTDRLGLLPDMDESGNRPYIVPVTSEDMVNWSIDTSDSADFVVLRESVWKPSPDDIYEQKLQTNYRELTYDKDGNYIINIWADTSSGQYSQSSYEIIDTKMPKIKGAPIKMMPFTPVNSIGISWDINKSVLIDLAEVNLSHYKTSADLEHGRHFTALPTPVLTGINSDTKLSIGSTTALAIADPRAKAYFLEFTGQGLGSLENAIKEKEFQMSSMSARLIDQNRKGSEAAETVRLRYSGEANMLAGIAGALEVAVNHVYNIIAEWLGHSYGDVKIVLNRDFLDNSMSDGALNVLTDMYLKKVIDLDTYIYNLKRGEIIEPGLSEDEIKQRFIGLKTFEYQSKLNSGEDNNVKV